MLNMPRAASDGLMRSSVVPPTELTEAMKSALVEAMSTVNFLVPFGMRACMVRLKAPLAGTVTGWVMS